MGKAKRKATPSRCKRKTAINVRDLEAASRIAGNFIELRR
jgi:hypothetical protein